MVDVSALALSADIGTDASVRNLTNWQSTAWFTQFAVPKVFQTDLDTGQTVVVAETSPYFPIHVETNGTYVVWDEFDRTSPRTSRWRIELMNIATGAVSVVDQAPDARVGALSGIGTSLAMDADQIVYSIGDPSAENPLRSTIIVRAIESGDVLRTIETDKVVFDLAAADQYVAYSEGRVDPDTSAAYEMDLMVSEAGVPEQKRVAEHSFHLASDGALLVWESQPDGLDGGASPASAIVGTQLPGVSRMVLSSPETTTGEAAADSPTAADGAVAWDEARAGIDHLVLRTDPTTALDLAQAETHFRPHIGGGWLVWQVLGEVSPGHESQALLGIALSNVPA